ncbi:3-oxoacyl-[acyl-carrier-protein] synthase III, chloroplastic-like protein, partial [Tanacetum coccineum]
MKISSSSAGIGFCSANYYYNSKTIRCSNTSPQYRPPKLISKGCKLVGCGSAVPNRQISNHDLAQIIDTSDEWISSRTGIRNRRILT